MTDKDFHFLVESAGMAPSSDNTQPWTFSPGPDFIDVYMVRDRLLAIDVLDMYSFISIGAAIENMILAAGIRGLECRPDFSPADALDQKNDSSQSLIPVARLHFTPADSVSAYPAVTFSERHTDRRKFSTRVLPDSMIKELSGAAAGSGTAVHWIRDIDTRKQLVGIDSVFSSILLSHPPLFDGLFNTVKFSRRKLLSDGWGMDIKSLDLPFPAAIALRIFGSRSLGRIIARWGVGPLVAKGLSERLSFCGALCLVTAPGRSRRAFLEAGRTMQSVWLKATELGLSVHPYGVITQYLHMAELEPWRFTREAVATIKDAKPHFSGLFGCPETRHPVMILRLGYGTGRQRSRLTVRFPPEKIMTAVP
ncbi:hypothetical protein [Marispirochaeta sp.]|jgi:nitroreductase|uniref:hypothetical protein n=1 Tax=Marispirochaeta sp. TaxID=2038653 RepID=UPI0029C6512F|nr:hypothetical protein [Marispirochaeta sp.]